MGGRVKTCLPPRDLSSRASQQQSRSQFALRQYRQKYQ
jgi:hypothetical protein